VEGKKRLTIAEVIWTYQGTITSNSVKVRAKQLGGCDIEIQNAQVDKVKKTITGHDLPAVKDFDPKVKFFDPLVLVWEISLDGGKTFTEAGTSQNSIYVCLNGPSNVGLGPITMLVPMPFRTTVHLACSNDGAEEPINAFEKTWELFLGKDVKGWDEATKGFNRKLYYYKPGTTFAQNPYGSAQALLQSPNDSGQCSTWASLLCDAGMLNGATSWITTALPIPNNDRNAQMFAVNDWNFINDTTSPPENATGIFVFPTSFGEMQPLPSENIYGSWLSLETLIGQNSFPQAPSEKVFALHIFVLFVNPVGLMPMFFDPSYGETYSVTLVENAIISDFQGKAVDFFLERPLPDSLGTIAFRTSDSLFLFLL
jgi:hypothetical protein